MVRLQGPLMSMSAQKQLGHELIYKQKGGKSFLTAYNKPGGKNPFKSSPTQKDKRMIYNLIIARWQTLTDEQRAVYNDLVAEKRLNMSGWNYFYQQSLKDLPTYLGLIGYWSFNEIVGGQILDLSGNGNNANPGPTYPTNSPVLVDSFGAKFGKAAENDSPTETADGKRFLLDSYVRGIKSFEVWVKRGAGMISNEGMILHNVAEGIDTNFCFFHRSVNTWAISMGLGNTNIKSADNEWTNVVGTYDGTNWRFYVNSVLGLTQENIGKTYKCKGIMGRNDTTNRPFNGWIDEVRFYDRVLSVEEIQKHYNLIKKK